MQFIVYFMFNVNSSFYNFLTSLQDRLQTEFDLKALSKHVCFLHGDGIPIGIVYYLHSAKNRIPVDSDTRCVHVDEDLWVMRPALLLNRIAALAGHAKRVYARDTAVARIAKPVAMAFQQEHHLQVPLPGKYRYGLFHNGELVSIAIFSGGRKMDGKPEEYRSFELLRFCHKQGMQVVGGFSKLLEAFQRELNPGDIMTYADKDWSDGSSYRKTGFTIVGEIASQLFWVDIRTMKRYDERTLPTLLAAANHEQRQKNGYVPVYNGGSIKLVKYLS